MALKKPHVPPESTTYDIRRTGTGDYYIVTVNNNLDSMCLYEDGTLVSFATRAEAREYKTYLEG